MNKSVRSLMCGLVFAVSAFGVAFADTTPSPVEAKLAALNLTLPEVSAPIGSYVPTTKIGKTLMVSGQLPMQVGKLQHAGTVGVNVTEEDAMKAAQICALNLLAQVKASGVSLDKVKCVKLTGFVSAKPGFENHPKVINGASDLMVAVLGDNGKHARAAVGVASLPKGAAVEIEGIFEILE